MKCPSCRTDNPPDSKFCKECATPLPPSQPSPPSPLDSILITQPPEAAQQELTTGSLFAGRFGALGITSPKLESLADYPPYIQLMKPKG